MECKGLRPIDELKRFARQLEAQLIVFAIFDITEERKRTIMELCATTGIKVLIAPSPKELHEVGEGVSRRLRSVDINDLLGRSRCCWTILERKGLSGPQDTGDRRRRLYRQ